MSNPSRDANLEHPQPTILIVDDVADIRLAYRYVLEEAQYRILDTFSAEQALKLIAENKVDLVITDLFMPGSLDGVGLIGVIKAMRPPIPVVVAISGAPHRAYKSSLQSARYIGADATLEKPIEAGVLINTVRSLIGGGPSLRSHR